MKSLWLKLMMPLVIAGVMVACSSGGGGFAGIGGSGFISTGTVTGFGSVFVNGVEFETGSAVFEIEDASGSEQDLRIGMVVQVQGSVNADGVTGTATAIRYADQLEGPVEALSVNGDQTVTTFTVFGNPVVVKRADTVLEGVTFGALADNTVLEISGFYDDAGVLRASYIEFKSGSYNASTIFEIRGPISGLSGTSFQVRGVSVNAVAANLSDLPDGLQNGVSVEVKGTWTGTTLNATEVEGDEIEYRDDGSEVSIEGYITRYSDATDFDIDDYPVNATGATLEPTTLQLGLGARVEAEGHVSNGVLFADEIEARAGDAEIHATVSNINAVGGTFDLNVASLGTVTVTVNNSTSLEDDLSEIEPFTLANLNNGDFVEVSGIETGVATMTAAKVKRRVSGDIILQGIATAATGSATTGGTITVFDVVYNFDTSTDFENELDVNLSNTEINNLLNDINSSMSVLIKIKDQDGDGVAEEIDIEE